MYQVTKITYNSFLHPKKCEACLSAGLNMRQRIFTSRDGRASGRKWTNRSQSGLSVIPYCFYTNIISKKQPKHVRMKLTFSNSSLHIKASNYLSSFYFSWLSFGFSCSTTTQDSYSKRHMLTSTVYEKEKGVWVESLVACFFVLKTYPSFYPLWWAKHEAHTKHLTTLDVCTIPRFYIKSFHRWKQRSKGLVLSFFCSPSWSALLFTSHVLSSSTSPFAFWSLFVWNLLYFELSQWYYHHRRHYFGKMCWQ